MDMADLMGAVRDVPDFPKPGIVFKDITPLLADGALFDKTIGIMEQACRERGAQKVAAIAARGLIFGGAVALRLGCGFVPVRKKGKLPYRTYEETYALEYGVDTVAIHQDAFREGERVVLIDDVLATGGTAAASARLVERAGGTLVGVVFLMELGFLNGREKLNGRDVVSLLRC